MAFAVSRFRKFLGDGRASHKCFVKRPYPWPISLSETPRMVSAASEIPFLQKVDVFTSQQSLHLKTGPTPEASSS